MPEIEAQITKVIYDEPWYRIHTDDSDIKRLDTQDEDRGAEAGRIKKFCAETGEAVKIVFTQSTKEKDGRVWENNYFQHAEPIKKQAAAPEDNGIEIATPASREYGYRTHPETSWRICLGTGVKVAMILMPSVAPEQRTMRRVKDIARETAEFLFFEPVPDNPQHPDFRPPPMGAFDAYGNPTPRREDEDDIPF